MDIQSLPTRVYLPPALPETFELGLPHGQDDIFHADNNSSPPLNLVWMPPSSQNPPGLSTSPLTRSFLGCINFTVTSDVLPMSAFQAQPQTSTPSSKPSTESFESAYSPELSPPPQAHTDPILIKRALFPWHRHSPLYSTAVDAAYPSSTQQHTANLRTPPIVPSSP
ncbi:hypothetical protein JB92DRAFT_3116450 [Gautieria morchelliformis]|nr:hypothetical protein JB92DRAFT_3116450 [Gautieria morchelliformis]